MSELHILDRIDPLRASIFCLLYNALAKRIGGFKVEFSLEGRDADASPASHE